MCSSDLEILAFMQERYGDFILYNPRISAGTIALWFGPMALFAIALLVLLRLVRRHQPAPVLSENDQHRLDQLLGKSDQR